MGNNFEQTLLSDDPLNELDDELFGRSHLVERVIDVLGHVRTQSTSSTIGLVGSWGSGKSSVLTNTVSQIRIPNATTTQALGEKWLVAEFNPWLFADPHALHAGFFTTLRDAFPDQKKWNDVRGKVIKLGRYVAPAAGIVTAFVGGDGEKPTSNFIDQFQKSAVEQHAAISKKLEELKQPVLIVVDDLDRLTATELLEVFKLVRLVGRLPYVYYVLGYDENTLVDLLAKTDLVSTDDDRRALEYLEKIVQVRLDMPLLRPFEIDRVVDRTLTFLAQKHKVTFDDDTMQTLSRRFDDVMSKRLRTPRSIKRLFGQIDAFLPSVGDEVHYGDYVVMTWLRTMEPGVYDLIQRRRHELLAIGTDTEREREAPQDTLEVIRQRWLKALTDAHVAESDSEDVFWLLSTLFPSLREIYRNGTAPQTGAAPEPQPGRVCHPHYFDRFFSFGVSADDVPDATARNGVAQIIRGEVHGEHAQRLVTAFGKDPRLALSKVVQTYQSSPSSSPTLVSWSAERWKLADDASVRSRLEGHIADLLRILTVEEIQTVSETLLGSDDGLLLASHLRAIFQRPSYARRTEQESYEAAGAALSPLLDARLVERFTELASEHASPLELSDFLTTVARRWQFSNPDGMKTFFESVVPHPWGWLDCLVWLAPVTSVDGGTTFHINSGSRPAGYFKVLDVDAATRELAAEIETATALEDLPEETEATVDARRAFALATLRRNAEMNAEITASDTPQGR